jgi:diadenosine tetraphosphate (Ap4A) HIT family hydrolase
MAFLDIRPLSEGHTLVIPKEHYETVFDIPEEQLAQVHKAAKRVAAAVKAGVKADGISIIQQNGRAANQDIFHLHVHIIPRVRGQKLPRFGDLFEASRDSLNQTAIKNQTTPLAAACLLLKEACLQKKSNNKKKG